jgi:hypothetical protein
MTDAQIAAGRNWDRVEQARYYGKASEPGPAQVDEIKPRANTARKTVWTRLADWLR